MTHLTNPNNQFLSDITTLVINFSFSKDILGKHMLKYLTLMLLNIFVLIKMNALSYKNTGLFYKSVVTLKRREKNLEPDLNAKRNSTCG